MAPCWKLMVRKVAQSSWDTKRNSAIWISRAKVSFWRDATLRGGDGVSPHDAHSMVHGPCGRLHGFFNGFCELTPIPDLLQSHMNRCQHVCMSGASFKTQHFPSHHPFKIQIQIQIQTLTPIHHAWHQSVAATLWRQFFSDANGTFSILSRPARLTSTRQASKILISTWDIFMGKFLS